MCMESMHTRFQFLLFCWKIFHRGCLSSHAGHGFYAQQDLNFHCFVFQVVKEVVFFLMQGIDSVGSCIHCFKITCTNDIIAQRICVHAESMDVHGIYAQLELDYCCFVDKFTMKVVFLFMLFMDFISNKHWCPQNICNVKNFVINPSMFNKKRNCLSFRVNLTPSKAPSQKIMLLNLPECLYNYHFHFNSILRVQ